MLAWALQPGKAAECLFHVSLAVYGVVQAFQFVVEGEMTRPKLSGWRVSVSTYHWILCSLYWSLGVIDLVAFGVVFDKSADFFSSYMKSVSLGIMSVALGSSHLVAVLLLKRSKASGKRTPPDFHQRIRQLLLLDPGATLVLALTVVRWFPAAAVYEGYTPGSILLCFVMLAQARDDYSWISRYASELAWFASGLLFCVGFARLYTFIQPQATDVLYRVLYVGGALTYVRLFQLLCCSESNVFKRFSQAYWPWRPLRGHSNSLSSCSYLRRPLAVLAWKSGLRYAASVRVLLTRNEH